VTWDVVDVELSDAIRACDEGLLETIDHSTLPAAPDGTPATEDFLPGTLHDCAVANIVWSSVYAYDSSKTRNWNTPTTMADFFNTKAFPGKRGMRKSPKVTMEFALIADGVPVGEVYNVLGTEEGVARAFAKLDTIKDDVVWWEAGAQPPQLLADGEVVFSTAWNGRVFNAKNAEGQSFEMVWDGQIYDLDLWVIPKGSKNKEAALDFVAFSTATEQLVHRRHGFLMVQHAHHLKLVLALSILMPVSIWQTICLQLLQTLKMPFRTTTNSGQTMLTN